MIEQLLEKELHIFDLDDTLINTRDTYGNAQKRVVEAIVEHHGDLDFEDELSHLRWFSSKFSSSNPEGYFDAYRTSLIGKGKRTLPESQELIDLYNEDYWGKLSAFQKIKDYLDRLNSEKKKIAIVSNGYTNLQLKKLEVTGLFDYFELKSIFVSEMFHFKFKKPSPHMLQQVCASYKTEANKAVYYGNITEDIIAGNLADLFTVFVGATDHSEDYLVSCLAEPNMLLKKRWLSLLDD